MLGLKSPNLNNFRDPQKMQSLLGDPIFMSAMGVLSNRKNRFAGGLEGLAASDKYGREIDEEKRQKALYELQMKTGEFNLEQAQEKKGKGIVADTVIAHFQENPYAVAFGGPKATPQQQMAGLISRGVDPSVAADLVRVKLEEQKMEMDNRRLNEPPDPYYVSIPTADGVLAFDARTGKSQLSPGGENAIPLPQDPAQQMAIMRYKSQGELDAKFESAIAADYPSLQKTYGILQETRDLIASGKATLGPGGVGLLGSVFDPETAVVEANQIIATISQLKDAGLTPVSNADLITLQKEFGNLAKGEKVNVAVLDNAIKIIEGQIATMEDKIQYFMQNGGSLMGYVPKAYREKYQRPYDPAAGPNPPLGIVPGSSPAQGYTIKSK